MMINGKLLNDKIIIENSKDIGRLYNKSNFGKIIKGNILELDLLEGIFLKEEGKIQIKENKKIIDFQNLVQTAAKKITDFEVKYLVFKDLRKRGHAVKNFSDLKGITYSIEKKDEVKKFVSVFSERDVLDLNAAIELIEYVNKKKGTLWFAILDEEGDITYYEVSKADIKGKIKKHSFKKSKGLFLKDRVIIFDEKNSKELLEKEFYGKFFGEGLQISLVESVYLSEENLIDICDINEKKIAKSRIKKAACKLQPDLETRLDVFRDLKKRGLIVKTGYKFGTHFRVYTKKPDEAHAEYLVHVVKDNFKSVWAEISRAVRLAHSVNKEIVFASVGKKIEYIRFGRLRP